MAGARALGLFRRRKGKDGARGHGPRGSKQQWGILSDGEDDGGSSPMPLLGRSRARERSREQAEEEEEMGAPPVVPGCPLGLEENRK